MSHLEYTNEQYEKIIKKIEKMNKYIEKNGRTKKVEKFEDKYIKSKNAIGICLIAQKMTGADKEKLTNGIIATKNPSGILRFADTCKGEYANLEKLYDALIETGDIKRLLIFAKDFNVNAKKIEEIVLNSGDANIIRDYADTFANIDIDKLTDAIIATGNVEEIMKFADNVEDEKNAEKLTDAVITFGQPKDYYDFTNYELANVEKLINATIKKGSFKTLEKFYMNFVFDNPQRMFDIMFEIGSPKQLLDFAININKTCSKLEKEIAKSKLFAKDPNLKKVLEKRLSAESIKKIEDLVYESGDTRLIEGLINIGDKADFERLINWAIDTKNTRFLQYDLYYVPNIDKSLLIDYWINEKNITVLKDWIFDEKRSNLSEDNENKIIDAIINLGTNKDIIEVLDKARYNNHFKIKVKDMINDEILDCYLPILKAENFIKLTEALIDKGSDSDLENLLNLYKSWFDYCICKKPLDESAENEMSAYIACFETIIDKTSEKLSSINQEETNENNTNKDE